MTTLKFYNDIHKSAPNEIKVDLPTQFVDPYTFSLGDNHDLANCLKEDVENLKLEAVNFINNWRTNAIAGNHERLTTDNELMFFTTSDKVKVIMAHGDFESWSTNKALKYRTAKMGASKFKRNVIVKAIQCYEENVGRKPSAYHIKNAVSLAKNRNCSVYICGHVHLKETYDQVHDGVRIVVLKRGYNEVNI